MIPGAPVPSQPSMPARLTALLVVASCGALLACGGHSEATPIQGPLVDEQRGTIDGLGLGDSAQHIRRELGTPDDPSTLVPTGEVGLPWIVAPPNASLRTLRSKNERVAALYYRGLYFLYTPKTGVYHLATWRKGAHTKAGIRLGDRLADARRRYPRLKCGVRNQHSEYQEYPYCRGRVGRLWIWFGQDPIRSITISATSIG